MHIGPRLPARVRGAHLQRLAGRLSSMLRKRDQEMASPNLGKRRKGNGNGNGHEGEGHKMSDKKIINVRTVDGLASWSVQETD